jgi:hypothetical protein
VRQRRRPNTVPPISLPRPDQHGQTSRAPWVFLPPRAPANPRVSR